MEFPDRPLIRISSTFFWHLSSDYDLVPIAVLKDKARILRSQNLQAGLNEGDEVDYEPMKVGQQVRKLVLLASCAFEPSFIRLK